MSLTDTFSVLELVSLELEEALERLERYPWQIQVTATQPLKEDPRLSRTLVVRAALQGDLCHLVTANFSCLR